MADPVGGQPAEHPTTPPVVSPVEIDTSGQLTRQQRAEVVQATILKGMEALSAEVAAGPSPLLKHFLEFAARFHTYSPGNQLLIALQCPEATRVAGYRAWEQLGYHVARGQHGIRILAPNTARIKETDPETGEERVVARHVNGFRVVSVFDASQLNPDELAERPLPVFFHPLGDDPTGLADRLQVAIEAEGITVVEGAHGSAEGWSQGGMIGLKPDLDPLNRAFTLIHEYTHEILHHGEDAREIPQAIKEWHAETVAYIVAYHFGLHNPFSADYVLSYHADPKKLFEELRSISLAASHIIQAIEQQMERHLGGSQEPEAARGTHAHRERDHRSEASADPGGSSIF